MEATRDRREVTRNAIYRCGRCERKLKAEGLKDKAARKAVRITWTKTWTDVQRADQMFRRTENHAWTHPNGTVTRGKNAPSVYCDCGCPMAGNVIRGALNDSVACNAKCTGAVGHDCECSCGGANHGADHS